MDKFNFVRNGVIRLPPGFRFQPTDEEIIFQYLRRKVFSCPLPASIIPELNVSKYDPWDLPGDMGLERYFSATRKLNTVMGREATEEQILEFLNQTENWVLCRIFLKKRNAKDEDEIIHENNFKDVNNKVEQVGIDQPRCFNFSSDYVVGPESSSSSSCSSTCSSITAISEVSSSDQQACHEESSTNF
ncbi:hypothetical protein FNV43_RR21265 [Rhamnella rubrinervis]|uniref:NAC domain-containing protein n=1 Tax=Rhamnella rubrinervis TaxID=2594499 RepID=A0A8K0E0F0_9ROSA|nr:hypothetical protein FNV43_RR21265 [Rhamnella rubrinervis]